MADNRSESLFTSLVYSIHMTALQQLGAVVNPMTGKKDMDLPQAMVSIEMIDMLMDKTGGHLNKNEADFIKKCSTELRQFYDRASR